MIPQNRASTTPVLSALLYPDDLGRETRLLDYEMGGVAVGDASQGLQVRTWRAWVDAGQVLLAPWPENAPVTALFAADGVSGLSLAFDQLMHPTVAYVQDGMTKLYWYDTLAAAQVTTSFPDAANPAVCLDDKRAVMVQQGITDVLFLYLRAGGLYYRQQRDRFNVERVLAPTLASNVSRVESVGMGVNGRLQVRLLAAPAAHADVATDQLYLALPDGTVRALGGGDPMTARWRSKVFDTDEQPSFGWVRVEATAYPVLLRLWGDGHPVLARNVPSEAPMRVPAMRAREWLAEVGGAARVMGVRLAETWAELEDDDAQLIAN